MLLISASLSSLTNRSCSVRFARSTRPFAWLELAHRISMFSSAKARPNSLADFASRNLTVVLAVPYLRKDLRIGAALSGKYP